MMGSRGGRAYMSGSLNELCTVNLHDEIADKKTHDICSSVLFDVSTPVRNITAENLDNWMKLYRSETNSSLWLWSEVC